MTLNNIKLKAGLEIGNASVAFVRECKRIADKYNIDRFTLTQEAARIHLLMVESGKANNILNERRNSNE